MLDINVTHKVITGRRDKIRTIRQPGWASTVLLKRSESEYDPFGAAHSSISISAGLAWQLPGTPKKKTIK